VTVTVAKALIEVEPFEAIAVYVVLTLGLTLLELFRPTEPIPLSIVTDVAFVDVHVSVVDPPSAMDVGFADNCTVGVDPVTVTVVELFAVALAPVAVAV